VGARPAPCRHYVIQLTLEACAGEGRRTISGMERARRTAENGVGDDGVRDELAIAASERPASELEVPIEGEDQSSGRASRVP